MRLAVFSDVHSNPFALRAVLADVAVWRADLLLCAGDVFGYYPWAQETFEMLHGLTLRTVLGNHDELVRDTLLHADARPASPPPYFEAAAQNGRALSVEAREWLHALPTQLELNLAGRRIRMVHGTPDDLLEGRFYPDNTCLFPWFPGAGEILILGHTHHPIVREFAGGGLLINPGSVGQPRDGDPRPSWIALEVTAAKECRAELRRVNYDTSGPMALLREMNWPPRFIAALNKTTPGPLENAPSRDSE